MPPAAGPCCRAGRGAHLCWPRPPFHHTVWDQKGAGLCELRMPGRRALRASGFCREMSGPRRQDLSSCGGCAKAEAASRPRAKGLDTPHTPLWRGWPCSTPADRGGLVSGPWFWPKFQQRGLGSGTGKSALAPQRPGKVAVPLPRPPVPPPPALRGARGGRHGRSASRRRPGGDCGRIPLRPAGRPSPTPGSASAPATPWVPLDFPALSPPCPQS